MKQFLGGGLAEKSQRHCLARLHQVRLKRSLASGRQVYPEPQQFLRVKPPKFGALGSFLL
eukprot:928808-Amphidinium_carterae.1